MKRPLSWWCQVTRKHRLCQVTRKHHLTRRDPPSRSSLQRRSVSDRLERLESSGCAFALSAVQEWA